MPDDDSALHESGLFINSVRSRLTEHFADSAFRSFEVVLCARKTFSKSIVAVFDIREINLEFAFESLQIFNGFVPICIADHGDGEGGVQRFQNRIGEMHRRHQIDIVRTFRNELAVNFPQPLHGNFLPLAFTADFVVLAVDAAQVAAGKKNCSGAFGSADAGFFPEVQTGAGDDRVVSHFAETGPAAPVHSAFAGAGMTFVHDKSPFLCGNIA